MAEAVVGDRVTINLQIAAQIYLFIVALLFIKHYTNCNGKTLKTLYIAATDAAGGLVMAIWLGLVTGVATGVIR